VVEEESDVEDNEQLREASYVGWRARQKTAETQRKRGFTSSARPADSSSGIDSNSVDDKKKNIRCADSKEKGHWRGDPQ